MSQERSAGSGTASAGPMLGDAALGEKHSGEMTSGGAGQDGRYAARTHVEQCMGTVFSFRLADPQVPAKALERAVRRLHDIDAMFSTYRSDSLISRIADGSLPIERAGAQVAHVLAECARFEQLTDGYFSARPDGSTLDPSGYVKGWAIQLAAQDLAAAGARNFCVNGGGDVACAGGPDPDRGWRIGIADPHVPGQLLETVQAARTPLLPMPETAAGSDEARACTRNLGQGVAQGVATSGTAERGHHVLDPHDGRPVTDLAAVTVIAEDLITADVYATAALAMGRRRGTAWLSRQPGIRALLVGAEGRRIEVLPDEPTS